MNEQLIRQVQTMRAKKKEIFGEVECLFFDQFCYVTKVALG